LVTLVFLLFSSYFICYLTHLQTTYATNAEDLGIMDQAIWSTVHGQILHQTICNTISDTNCASSEGITRLAIHVEPILFPISLLYLLWPDPRTLLVLQTIVVAAGAYPAFWLARLRLRNELAAVAIALLYLLYPAQQQAIVSDFHAVTFTASLLLFTFYFLYTRRTGWLFVCAFLSMTCKEEIPLVITMFGIWSVLFQHRWPALWVLVSASVILQAASTAMSPNVEVIQRDIGLRQGVVWNRAVNIAQTATNSEDPKRFTGILIEWRTLTYFPFQLRLRFPHIAIWAIVGWAALFLSLPVLIAALWLHARREDFGEKE